MEIRGVLVWEEMAVHNLAAAQAPVVVAAAAAVGMAVVPDPMETIPQPAVVVVAEAIMWAE